MEPTDGDVWRFPRDPSKPRRYYVCLVDTRGQTKRVPVVTDSGPLKAVYLAAATLRSVIAAAPTEVTVEDVGPVEVDGRGVAILDRWIHDRGEW